jgi:Putative addiction module component
VVAVGFPVAAFDVEARIDLWHLVFSSRVREQGGHIMKNSLKTIVNQVLGLSVQERSIIAEQLLLSLQSPDDRMDALWAEEAEARIDAYERGELESVPVNEVVGKYENN